MFKCFFMFKFQYQKWEKRNSGEKKFWIIKRGNKGITNRGRFQGLKIGARGIANRDSIRDSKSGQTDYKSGQGFQIGAKRFQIGAEIINRGRISESSQWERLSEFGAMISDSSDNHQLPQTFQKSRLYSLLPYFAQKMKFSIKGFFIKCDQIRSKLRMWSHLLEKSLMENLIFCAVMFCSLERQNESRKIDLTTLVCQTFTTSYLLWPPYIVKT